MDIKIKSVLIGIAVGWLLSQGTELIKSRLVRRRKIKAIYVELADLSAWLHRHLLTAKLCIQLAVNRKIVTNIPTHLQKFLLDEYFHEICIYLPRGARLGLTECISQISYFNSTLEEISELLKSPSTVDNRDFIAKYQSLYSVCKETKFKIDFLLQNRDGDLAKLHGAAEKLAKDTHDELQAIINEAKSTSPEKLEKAHYSEE